MMIEYSLKVGDNGTLDIQVDAEAVGGEVPECCRAAMEAVLPHLMETLTDAVPWMVAVRIGGEEEGRRLNREFRGKDYPTNVLSFESGEEEDLEEEWHVGDLFICWPVVLREAAEQEVSVNDHVSHLVVHGMLHLMGYDHMEAGEAEEMERMETEILAGLGIADPYAGELADEREATA